MNVSGVIAPVRLDPALAHLPDDVHHPIQEVAIVADNQHRAIPVAQRVLQPFNRLHVQMVRRFVQDQQVGLLEQKARQENARLLPAAQVADG